MIDSVVSSEKPHESIHAQVKNSGHRIGSSMGIGVVGFNWRHGISAVLGYLLSSWTHNPEPVVSAIQDAECLWGIGDSVLVSFQSSFLLYCDGGGTGFGFLSEQC